jgi:signal transduction histidine kinase
MRSRTLFADSIFHLSSRSLASLATEVSWAGLVTRTGGQGLLTSSSILDCDRHRVALTELLQAPPSLWPPLLSQVSFDKLPTIWKALFEHDPTGLFTIVPLSDGNHRLGELCVRPSFGGRALNQRIDRIVRAFARGLNSPNSFRILGNAPFLSTQSHTLSSLSSVASLHICAHHQLVDRVSLRGGTPSQDQAWQHLLANWNVVDYEQLQHVVAHDLQERGICVRHWSGLWEHIEAQGGLPSVLERLGVEHELVAPVHDWLETLLRYGNDVVGRFEVLGLQGSFVARPLSAHQGAQLLFTPHALEVSPSADGHDSTVLALNELSDAITTLGWGVLTIDPNGIILSANATAQSCLGVAQCRGLAISSISPPLSRLISNPSPTPTNLEVVDRQGRRRSLEVGQKRLSDGNTLAFLRETMHANTELERKRAEHWAWFGAQAARFAHDIKNSLHSLSAGFELLQGQSIAPKLTSILEPMKHEAQRMSQSFQYLSTLSRDRSFSPVPLSLRNVVLDVARETSNYCQSRSVRLEIALEQTEAIITVDENEFHRLLSNLLINAVEATGRAGVVRIEGRIAPPEAHNAFPGFLGKMVVIDVLDDGPGFQGIDPMNLVQPFVTTKSNGTGLGLSIASEVVAQHGGVLLLGDGARGAHAQVVLPSGWRPTVWESPDRHPQCSLSSSGTKTSGYCCFANIDAPSGSARWNHICLACERFQKTCLTPFCLIRHPLEYPPRCPEINLEQPQRSRRAEER